MAKSSKLPRRSRLPTRFPSTVDVFEPIVPGAQIFKVGVDLLWFGMSIPPRPVPRAPAGGIARRFRAKDSRRFAFQPLYRWARGGIRQAGSYVIEASWAL